MMRPANMLLVEDNEADIELTLEGLEMCNLRMKLDVVRDGEAALRYLAREGEFADAPRPDLVLLDLNLPRVTGREVLEAMREMPSVRRVPVVVLTSSDASSDVLRSYDLGANCYVRKPLDFDRFKEIVAAIEGFWFTVVSLPTVGARDDD